MLGNIKIGLVLVVVGENLVVNRVIVVVNVCGIRWIILNFYLLGLSVLFVVGYG